MPYHPHHRRRTLVTTFVACGIVAFASKGAHAQYIARKLTVNGFPQSAVAVSGNRAVGTFGSSFTRLREDAMLWDIRTGVPTFPESPINSSFNQISGDWVVESQFDFSVIQVTSNRSYVAKNLLNGQTYNLGTSASANNSQGFTAVTPDMRENWAFSNTRTRAIFIGPYDIYGSRAVNLTTGQVYDFSWGTSDPFTYIPRQIIDISGGRTLVNATATGYGFLNLTTGAITDITTGLSSVAGMSGNYIAGIQSGSGAAAIYEIAANTMRTLGTLSGVSGVSVSGIGANQTIGNGTSSGQQVGLLWNNATGAATNLHAFLPAGYVSSTTLDIDKNFADGPILLNATTSGGVTDQVVLRRVIDSAFVGIGADETATFENDYTQTGGVVSNGGTIQWTNPPRSWVLLGGLLTGTGILNGGVLNTGGGTLSGGLSSGGSGSGGSGGGFSGSGGAGSGIGAFSATGGYTQGGASVLLVTIGGASSFDTFTFDGTANLGGIVQFDLMDGFTPTAGQQFTFFFAPNLVGTWDSIVSNRGSWDVIYNGNSATATYLGGVAAAAPEPGTVGLLAIIGLPIAAGLIRRSNRR